MILDWDDEYAIERVGLYFSRQGRSISWSVDEIVEATASDPNIALGELRREFRSCAQIRVMDARTSRLSAGDGVL